MIIPINVKITRSKVIDKWMDSINGDIENCLLKVNRTMVKEEDFRRYDQRIEELAQRVAVLEAHIKKLEAKRG